MPRGGVTVTEQRKRFLEDYQLTYYPVTELPGRFSIVDGEEAVRITGTTHGAG